MRPRDGKERFGPSEKVHEPAVSRQAIFKPLNTGRIGEHVACVREWVANIFFYTKNGVTIMIDAGYNYARLREKMDWHSTLSAPEMDLHADLREGLLHDQDCMEFDPYDGARLPAGALRTRSSALQNRI